MYCSKCGTENSESAKFFSNYGQSFIFRNSINIDVLEKKVEIEPPTAMIIITWLLMLFSFSHWGKIVF